jgi:hypothetical protein
MIISDLEHLEAVGEESRIEGGLQMVSGSSSASSGLATTGRVNTSNSSYSSAYYSEYYSYYGGYQTSYGTSSSGYASGSTSPSYYY